MSEQKDLTIQAQDRIGLALGGGGARGIAHILALEAFDELGLKPSMIAGTSIGSLYGAAYASGMSGSEIREYSLDLFRSRTTLLKKLYKKWPTSITELWNPMTSSLFTAEAVLKIALPELMPATFEELEIPFLAVATDFYAQQQIPISTGPLVPAIAASCALPAVLQPVELNGRILIDGGFVNPLPYDHVADGAALTVAIDVNGTPVLEDGGMPDSMEVVLGASQIILGSIVREKLQHSRPDIMITPDVGHIRTLDFFDVVEILKHCAPVKDELKRALEMRLQLASG